MEDTMSYISPGILGTIQEAALRRVLLTLVHT